MLRRGILEALVARDAVPRKLDMFTASSAETYGFFEPLRLAGGARLSGEASSVGGSAAPGAACAPIAAPV